MSITLRKGQSVNLNELARKAQQTQAQRLRANDLTALASYFRK
ncbi:hypothetical protein [Streptomyces phage Verabelle]|uniref:Uncharacterized protein n=1 Tax=Streptomyces phage Verabelle TaxID=3065247 RepID=A0AA50F1E4_9CAUD|nr:hypothetical protein [Streptomyces phage Verabelle]